VETAQTAETASGYTHGPNGATALPATESCAGAKSGAKKIVGVGAIVGVVGRYFFAALGVVVPVIEAILLIGVHMALLFFAAADNSECTDQNKRDLEGASPAHKYVPALKMLCNPLRVLMNWPRDSLLLSELIHFASVQKACSHYLGKTSAS
jgi:hypothetical protein